MLIGDRTRLGFDLLPVTPPWETRYEPERAGWAGLAIWVRGTNLCRHIESGSERIQDYLFVPLAPLADWLVRSIIAIAFEERAKHLATGRTLHADVRRWAELRPPSGLTEDEWMDAREAWWASHFLRAGADGAILPDLAFARDDEELVISWREHPGYQTEISFAPMSGDVGIPWNIGFSTLSAFVTHVAGSLREAQLDELYPWVVADDPLASALRGGEASLALFVGQPLDYLKALLKSPSAQDLQATLGLPQDWTDPAESSECQILRDLSPTISQESLQIVVQAGHASRSASGSDAGRWGDRRFDIADAMRGATSPEEEGQFAAQAIRRWLALDGQPISSPRELLADEGVEVMDGGKSVDQAAVAANDRGGVVAVVFESPRTATEWGVRFELCRSLGHALSDPVRSGALGAGSGPFARGHRRRRSGAFAAELLLPEVAIARASSGRLDQLAAEPGIFKALLDEYGIGARAAGYQLWNRGWLSSPVLRDELIDAFAAV